LRRICPAFRPVREQRHIAFAIDRRHQRIWNRANVDNAICDLADIEIHSLSHAPWRMPRSNKYSVRMLFREDTKCVDDEILSLAWLCLAAREDQKLSRM